MSKGSHRRERPNDKAFREGWDRIFSKDKKQGKPK